ncbi:MAG: TOBE domain-containing protein [Acetobacteraceae bacterium]|nr:TOBE domain-containing protein [Acetobacteraceae bacterium]
MTDGTVLRARAPWPPDGTTGAQAAICFRPLDVTLATTPGDGQGGVGVVEQRLFLGDLMQITLRCDGCTVVACDRPRGDLPEGTPVHWRVAPDRCVVVWR